MVVILYSQAKLKNYQYKQLIEYYSCNLTKLDIICRFKLVFDSSNNITHVRWYSIQVCFW